MVHDARIALPPPLQPQGTSVAHQQLSLPRGPTWSKLLRIWSPEGSSVIKVLLPFAEYVVGVPNKSLTKGVVSTASALVVSEKGAVAGLQSGLSTVHPEARRGTALNLLKRRRRG